MTTNPSNKASGGLAKKPFKMIGAAVLFFAGSFFYERDLNKVEIEEDALKIMPEDLAKYYQVLPVSKIGNVLTIAVANPFDIFTIDDVKIVTGHELLPVVSTDLSIKKASGRRGRSASIPGWMPRGGVCPPEARGPFTGLSGRRRKRPRMGLPITPSGSTTRSSGSSRPCAAR
jgi:hypothetical protein